MENTEKVREFGGWLQRYPHASQSCQCDMTFSVYLPPQAENKSVPVLYYLSGLTCTDDNVRTKAGAQRYAAEHGIALVMPDTSPRGDNVADDADRYDLGKGAGFYINASNSPWTPHYNMFDYVNHELPELIENNLPVTNVRSISGHSMGGHGAMISALKNPGRYKSVSAFAPIANPVNCGWGEGCFGAYIGSDKKQWQDWDSVCLMQAGAECPPLLVDQGGGDNFLAEQLSFPELQSVCEQRGFDATLRLQEHYDHSYHFIASFIGEHIAFHAGYLNA